MASKGTSHSLTDQLLPKQISMKIDKEKIKGLRWYYGNTVLLIKGGLVLCCYLVTCAITLLNELACSLAVSTNESCVQDSFIKNKTCRVIMVWEIEARRTCIHVCTPAVSLISCLTLEAHRLSRFRPEYNTPARTLCRVISLIILSALECLRSMYNSLHTLFFVLIGTLIQKIYTTTCHDVIMFSNQKPCLPASLNTHLIDEMNLHNVLVKTNNEVSNEL
jgi:hypothetical protein